MSYTSKKLIEDFAELVRNGNEYTYGDIVEWFYGDRTGRTSLSPLRKDKLTRMNILRVRRYLLKHYGHEWNFIRSENIYRILEAEEDWDEVTKENYNNLKGRVKTASRRYKKMITEHPRMLEDINRLTIKAQLEMINQLISSAETKLKQLEDEN